MPSASACGIAHIGPRASVRPSPASSSGGVADGSVRTDAHPAALVVAIAGLLRGIGMQLMLTPQPELYTAPRLAVHARHEPCEAVRGSARSLQMADRSVVAGEP